jgi:hypothetical protein
MKREMKVKLRLVGKPDPKFSEAATAIAKGPPPKWLLSGLDHFNTFVGGDMITTKEANEYRPIIEQMNYELGHLITWLPILQQMPFECPDDVAIAMDVLPRIRDALLPVPPRKKRPNVRRKTCAVVVVEAWILIHGKPNPLPEQLRSACREYWEACGGGDSGDDDWRRHVKEAAATAPTWIREVLSAYKTR